MAKIAIVTDSTADLAPADVERYGITVVPLSVVFGETAYKEGVEITSEQFYEKLKTSDVLPSTSQPSVGQFMEAYEALAGDYDDIISIHISSGISGTYQTAMSAAQSVEGVTVHGFDSEISSAPQSYFVLEAAKMAEAGESADKIIAHLQEIKKHVRAYFMVADLNHLQRGGRLSNAQAIVGSLLQIKPVLHFEAGKIVPFEKVRTEKRALKRILELFDDEAKTGVPIQATVIHGNRPEKGKEIANTLTSSYGNVDVTVQMFSPVIATHLGEGSLGLTWYTKK